MNLIILTPDDRPDGERYVLSDTRALHIREVLKCAVGDAVEIGIVDGAKGSARIAAIDDDRVTLEIETLTDCPRPEPTIDVICALPRPQTLKKVLWSTATMGVRHLYLIRANRVEKSYFHSPLLQPENYTRYLWDGLSQGRQTRCPIVTIHDRFRPFFEDTLRAAERADAAEAIKLLPHPEASRTMRQLDLPQSARLVVAIGPEGGWVPFEIETMTAMGFQTVLLGRWTLRVENAMTAVLAQIEMLALSE